MTEKFLEKQAATARCSWHIFDVVGFFFLKAEWTVQETNVISVLGTWMRKVITFIHHPPVRFGVPDDQVSCSHSVSVSLCYFLSDLSSQSSSWMSVYITSTLYHMGTNDILSRSAHGTPWLGPSHLRGGWQGPGAGRQVRGAPVQVRYILGVIWTQSWLTVHPWFFYSPQAESAVCISKSLGEGGIKKRKRSKHLKVLGNAHFRTCTSKFHWTKACLCSLTHGLCSTEAKLSTYNRDPKTRPPPKAKYSLFCTPLQKKFPDVWHSTSNLQI